MPLKKFWKSKQKKELSPQEPMINTYEIAALLDNGEQVQIECLSKEFILDELLDNNIDVAYGCANGVCGKCKAKLIKGTVEEHEQIGLTKEEIEQGYILVCKSTPTDNIQIQYDQE